jgi:hypothetical protein
MTDENWKLDTIESITSTTRSGSESIIKCSIDKYYRYDYIYNPVDEQKKMEFDMAKDGTSVLKVLMAP